MNQGGTFTTLRTVLAPMTWAEIVAVISEHARDQGIRWDDAARNIASAARETDASWTP